MMQEPPLECKLVAIIDDSPVVREIVEASLKREGFVVQGFPDGIEAFRWFAQADVRLPDLLLLDLFLPKLDGYGVLQHLKKDARLRTIPVIILSRRDGPLDKLKGRLAGAKGHISKPFKTQDVIGAVEASIGAAVECAHELSHSRPRGQQDQQ